MTKNVSANMSLSFSFEKYCLNDKHGKRTIHFMSFGRSLSK